MFHVGRQNYKFPLMIRKSAGFPGGMEFLRIIRANNSFSSLAANARAGNYDAGSDRKKRFARNLCSSNFLPDGRLSRGKIRQRGRCVQYRIYAAAENESRSCRSREILARPEPSPFALRFLRARAHAQPSRSRNLGCIFQLDVGPFDSASTCQSRETSSRLRRHNSRSSRRMQVTQVNADLQSVGSAPI